MQTKNFHVTQLRRTLRLALRGLPARLADEYGRGHIWQEADVQVTVINYLRRVLSEADDRWRIGACHHISRCVPDVTCYYRHGSWNDFVRSRDAAVIGVVEIKWASELGADLAKLRGLEKRLGVLTWMVYGDHFNRKIHLGYWRQQCLRAQKIRRWVSENPRSRGATILEVEAPRFRRRKHDDEVCAAFRRHWWINDSNAKAAQQGKGKGDILLCPY